MNMSAEPSSSSSSASLAPISAKVYLPAITAGALFIVTLMVMIRGGVSADLSGVSADQTNAAYQVIFARYIGVLDIVLGSLAPLAAMAAGAIGIGLVLRKFLLPQVSLLTTATAGLGLVWLIFEALACVGMANGMTAWGVCAVALVGGLACHANAVKQAFTQTQRIAISPYFQWHWSCVLVAPPLAMLLVAACCPPGTLWSVEAFGYDVLSYHLQIPREWLAAGKITGLEHNVYSYLPSLVETAFLQLGAMRGSMYKATYTAQLMNVALLLLTAAHLAKLVIALAPGPFAKAAGWFTAAIFLATPWVLVTGSMAYDEAAVLAFGAAALALTLCPCDKAGCHTAARRVRCADSPEDENAHRDSHANHQKNQTDNQTGCVSNRWAVAILAGVLVGLATQAKLTSGFMLAVPVGLIWLLRLTPDVLKNQRQNMAGAWRAVAGHVGLLTLAGVIILGPYLVRNAIWTGNPVFPFATAALGQGHWNNELADRWQRGHHVDETISQRLTALGQQWLFNTGYGSVGGRLRSVDPTKPEARNVAYFPKQWGFPSLLLFAFISWLLLLLLPSHRTLALALGLMVLVQIFAWLFLTHLQSRFMIFSLLPACIASGAGLALAAQKWLNKVPLAMYGICIVLAGVLTLTSASLLRQQAIGQLPLWQLVDALPTQEEALDRTFDRALVGDHPINKLPANSKTLLVADNSRLFYIQRPMLYHSAFDTNPLGQLIRQHPNDPQAVTAGLKAMGVTHIWLHGPELDRLMGSYGFDKDVTPQSLERLIATGWQPVPYRGMARQQEGRPLVAKVMLYRLP